jgi:hypothetical protein
VETLETWIYFLIDACAAVGSVVAMLLIIRTIRVQNFVAFCDDLEEAYFERHQELPHEEWYWFSRKLPDRTTLIFSWKPFTLEAWFKKEDIEKVKN